MSDRAKAWVREQILAGRLAGGLIGYRDGRVLAGFAEAADDAGGVPDLWPAIKGRSGTVPYGAWASFSRLVEAGLVDDLPLVIGADILEALRPVRLTIPEDWVPHAGVLAAAVPGDGRSGTA